MVFRLGCVILFGKGLKYATQAGSTLEPYRVMSMHTALPYTLNPKPSDPEALNHETINPTT